MIDKAAISECTCRGLNLLEKLSYYYIDRFEGAFNAPTGEIKQREDARKLSNELFNKLTDKGIKYKGDIPPVDSLKKDNTVGTYLRSCNSDNRDCVHLLEILMGRLHQSPEAQNKLICGHEDIYLDREIVDGFLSDIFRGDFYKTENKNYYEMQYNPFDKHFHEKHKEECKKYVKQ